MRRDVPKHHRLALVRHRSTAADERLLREPLCQRLWGLTQRGRPMGISHVGVDVVVDVDDLRTGECCSVVHVHGYVHVHVKIKTT